MAFKRVLLLLRGHPMPTPVDAVGAAIGVAVELKAKISALSCAILQHVPKTVLSGVIGVVPELVAEEHEKATNSARQQVQTFSKLARERGALGEAIYRACAPADVPGLLAGYARLHDLTIVPMPNGGYLDQLDSHWYLETALFDSGRPILVLPHDYHFPEAGMFGVVAVAWDHTRAAARALADALPILQQAKSVRLVTITNEKAIPLEPPSMEIVSHLAAHDIRIAYDAVDADGRDAGTAIVDYVRDHSANFLVMGGYGRSRLRELIMGGATRRMLTHPPVPVFMAH